MTETSAQASATPSGTPAATRHSPLHDRHVALGAKLADFGGFQMPIEYPGRRAARAHRGPGGCRRLRREPPRQDRRPRTGAAAFVNSALTNDLERISPGQAQYTLCCDDATGGVVDDLIAYLRAPDEVFLVPNAANTAEVARRLAAAAPPGVDVADKHVEYAVLAVQGPRSEELLAALGLPVGHTYMSFVDAIWRELPVVACRTGYTGEHGFELMPRAEHAAALWDALLEAGAEFGALPVGLGARDTLRTEMGYPLHGQDLSMQITPVQARLGWAVGWKKPAFWGREVLTQEKADAKTPLLRGIEATDRGIPRPHMTVRSAAGAEVGEVTSGTFSPTRRVGIGLALLDRSVAEGDEVLLDVRGRTSRMRVVKPPFVQVTPA